MTNLNVPMTAQMSTQTTVRITQTKAGHNSRETTKTLSHLSTRVYTPKRTHHRASSQLITCLTASHSQTTHRSMLLAFLKMVVVQTGDALLADDAAGLIM